MRAIKIRGGKGPEQKVLEAVRKMMVLHGWYVKKIHGGKYQSGLPDLYCTMKIHGCGVHRWIEIKDPKRVGEPFTSAQLETFPLLSANGTPVYVLTGATQEDYEKLFKSENWWQYLSASGLNRSRK